MFHPIRFLIDQFMIPFLTFSYNNIFPNYGIAIILLTIVIKLILFPLTHKQFNSMKKMQKIQPLFKNIKDKFKDNPQKLQQETLKLYKNTGVNPLSGCLPMLFQLPFLFALFYTMTSDSFKALISEPGVFPGLTSFWLPNLSAPDQFYILPLLIGGATFLSQKITPMAAEGGQQKIAMYMPIIMIFICLKMPAGVLLYWASSQIISTIQQISIMKKNK